MGEPEQRVDVYLVRLDAAEPPVAGLMRVFGLDQNTARDLVSRVPVRVKRNASLADATRIREALEALGGDVRIEPTAVSSIPAAAAARHVSSAPGSAKPSDGEWGPGESHSLGRGGAAPSERAIRGDTIAVGTLPMRDGFAEPLAPLRETVAGDSVPSGQTPVANSLALHDTMLGGTAKDTVAEPFAPMREKLTSIAPDGSDAPLPSVAPKNAPMLPPASDESLEPLLMRGFEFEMDTSSALVELDDGRERREHGHEGRMFADSDAKELGLALDDSELAALGPSARARQSDRPGAIRSRVGPEADKPPSVRPPPAVPISALPLPAVVPLYAPALSGPPPPSQPLSGPPASAPLISPHSRSGAPISLSPPDPPLAPLEPPSRMPIWAIAGLASIGLVAAIVFVFFAATAEDPVRIVRNPGHATQAATGGPFRTADPEEVDEWVEERHEAGAVRLEARAWLRVRTNSMAAMPPQRARALVEDLYRAGASNVEILDPALANGQNTASTIVADIQPPHSAFDIESAALQSLANIGTEVAISRGERFLVIVTN